MEALGSSLLSHFFWATLRSDLRKPRLSADSSVVVSAASVVSSWELARCKPRRSLGLSEGFRVRGLIHAALKRLRMGSGHARRLVMRGGN